MRGAGVRSRVRGLRQGPRERLRDRPLARQQLRGVRGRLPTRDARLLSGRGRIPVHDGLQPRRPRALWRRVRRSPRQHPSLRRLRRPLSRDRSRDGRVHPRTLRAHLQARVSRVRVEVRREDGSIGLRARVHAMPGAPERDGGVPGRHVRVLVQRRLRQLQSGPAGRMRGAIRGRSEELRRLREVVRRRRVQGRRVLDRARGRQALTKAETTITGGGARADARPASCRTTTCAGDGGARRRRGSRGGC